MISPPSAVRLGNAARLCVVLSLLSTGAIEGADCNQNCIEDLQEIRASPGRDCNRNGIPDDCDLEPANASFVSNSLFVPGGHPAFIRVADLDSDGRPDVILVDHGSTGLRNRIQGPIVLPVTRDVDSDGIIDSCQSLRFTRGDVTGEG